MDSHAVKSQQNVAVHTISFRGKAGAIFVLLCLTITLFVVGFVTPNWSKNGNNRMGLWEHCTCETVEHKDWLIAVEALMGVALLCLLISLLLIAIYMCVHTVSKNSTIIALVFFTFLAFVFNAVGYSLYAIKKSEEGHVVFWSFFVIVSSSFFCLIAAIISVVQLKSSGVRL